MEKNATKKSLIAHMPGHGGKSEHLKRLSLVAGLDTTETVISDNLFAPHGAMLKSFELATALFQSKSSVFSCGGATLGIEAMLLLGAGYGGKVIADRRCHQSVFHAAILLNLDIVWLSPKIDVTEPAKSFISAKDLENCMTLNSDAKAVIVTSPTYFGAMSNISALAETAHNGNMVLCVDNAHGSHLIALDGGKLHPIKQNADFVVDSAHKTLPALTGAAFFHSNIATMEEMLAAMSLFSTTSPSFLIAASLDLAREYLATKAEADIISFISEKAKFGETLKSTTPFSLLDEEHIIVDKCKYCENISSKGLIFDPLRVTIKCNGYHGEEILKYLAQNDVICEMANSDYLVLILPLWTGKNVFSRIQKELYGAVHTLKRDEIVIKSPYYNHIPKRAISCQKAYFLQRKRISICEAGGKIAASSLAPYPPGVPIIVAGEVFDDEVLALIPRTVQEVEIVEI